MLNRFLAAALLCLACPLTHASRTMSEPRPVRLMPTEAAAQPIELRQLTVSAVISGNMAQTTVRMVFYNPNPRQLEGNLQFPLLAGQQINAFALDIGGKMRPAVPVEKERGRAVFEAIVRRGVDPALLEVTEGNNFKLRVYPIMGRSTRTVELSYGEALSQHGGLATWRLPLEYGKVRDMDLTVRVNGAATAPVVDGLEPGLQFEPTAGAWQAHMRRQDFAASGNIVIRTAAGSKTRVYTEKRLGERWFLAEIPVAQVLERRTPPRIIGLLWDSSGSAEKRDINAELATLDQYFRALGQVQVRLTRLRDRPEAQQVFDIRGGNWSALRRALESTRYDGASALNDWKPQADVDQYLLMSDGLSNYGPARAPVLAPHQSLFAMTSSLSADSGRLAALAERHHGQFIRIGEGAADGIGALMFAPMRVEHVEATGATDIQAGTGTVEGGMLRIAGRLLAPDTTLSVTLANGAKTDTIKLQVDAGAPQHPLAALTWAAMRLHALEADADLHRAEIARIGRRFGIPTRDTSLIVLETLDDYVRYEIEPPADDLDAWRKRKELLNAGRGAARVKHLDEVVRNFQNRTAWWNSTFPRVPVKVAPALTQEYSRPVMVAPAPAPSAKMVADTPASFNRFSSAVDERSNFKPGMLVRQHETMSGQKTPAIGMGLKKWVPNAPYIQRMRDADAGSVYAIYLDQKPDYADSSAFYLDAADILLEKGQRDLALRVLSNLAEMDLENRAVLRILGYRLLQANAPQLAVPVFEKVQRLAGEEPQSWRDLGLALAATGRTQEAIDTLYEVVERPWDGRFPDIETIVLAEINAIVAASAKPLDVRRIDPRLRASLPLDLRVVLTWDADNSDMDLWVTAPNGEKSSYQHRLSSQGARMSNDFMGGYGPEEFSLRRAAPGKYRIEANYYGNRQQLVAGATTLQVKLFTAFGTPRQKEQSITLRLKERSETVFVGEFEVKP